MKPRENVAPHGQIWECRVCGKISTDKTGLTGYCSPGWDASCFLNSDLRPQEPKDEGKLIPAEKNPW